MENKIDLNNYKIRTDLVMELVEENTKNKVKTYNYEDIKVEILDVDSNYAKEINKSVGRYITISFDDVTNFETREKIGKVLENEIKKILKKLHIKEEAECLIIGLGNIKSTPDSLGPLTIQKIVVTKHLFSLNADVKEGIRKVSAIIPGVMGTTGIETSDMIKAIVKEEKPDFVITVDALAAASINRINKTIQMTDTGISPGSGIGNTRKELSSITLGLPVIAIGVPTVVDIATIVSDSITYLFNHISYIKNNMAKSKLTINNSNKYLKKIENNNLDIADKKELTGLLGTLDENTKKSLIIEVLNSLDYNLMVSVKEIDYIIDMFSDLIASALNNALHRQITHY